VRTAIGQAFDPSGFDCHFDRSASDGLEFEGVDCYLWRLEEETDGLDEVVKPHLEVAQCPETHGCNAERCMRGLMGMLNPRKVVIASVERKDVRIDLRLNLRAWTEGATLENVTA
jgi:hypothetical protein